MFRRDLFNIWCVACFVVQIYLRFVSRTPQHCCSIVEYWFVRLVTWMLLVAPDSNYLLHSELFVLSEGLAMLDSRCRLQRVSFKHTLHFCKATLAMCMYDSNVPDPEWTIVIFENPESCCFSMFSSPSQKGLLIGRIVITEGTFQPRKLSLFPWYGVICNTLFVCYWL